MFMNNQQLINEFITCLKVEKGLAGNTIEAYRRDLTKLEQFAETRGKTLLTVERDDIVASLAALKEERGNGDATLSRYTSAVRTFYRYLRREKLMVRDPTAHLESRKVWQTLPHFLTPDDVERLLRQPDLAAAEGVRDRTMLEVLYATGLRVSELLNLRLRDIDLDHGVLDCLGKGSKQRRVPLGRAAIDYLSAYCQPRM